MIVAAPSMAEATFCGIAAVAAAPSAATEGRARREKAMARPGRRSDWKRARRGGAPTAYQHSELRFHRDCARRLMLAAQRSLAASTSPQAGLSADERSGRLGALLVADRQGPATGVAGLVEHHMPI